MKAHRTSVFAQRETDVETNSVPIRGFYVKGPIPLSWITEAHRHGSAALAVGLMLWFKKGLTKTNAVRIGNSELAELIGAHRSTIMRAIERLESAGLVRVERGRGKKKTILIIEKPKEGCDDERRPSLPRTLG